MSPSFPRRPDVEATLGAGWTRTEGLSRDPRGAQPFPAKPEGRSQQGEAFPARERWTRLESGQAAAEYAWILAALLVGVGGLGWPYLELVLGAIARYFDAIYFVLDAPQP